MKTGEKGLRNYLNHMTGMIVMKRKMREAYEAIDPAEVKERRRKSKLAIFIKHYYPPETPVPDELRKVETIEQFKRKFFGD